MTHKVRAVRARPTDQALAVPVEPVFAVSPLRASILRASDFDPALFALWLFIGVNVAALIAWGWK